MGQSNCQNTCGCWQNVRPCEEERMMTSMGAASEPYQPQGTEREEICRDFLDGMAVIEGKKEEHGAARSTSPCRSVKKNCHVINLDADDFTHLDSIDMLEQQEVKRIRSNHTFKQFNSATEDEEDEEEIPEASQGVASRDSTKMSMGSSSQKLRSTGAQLAKEELMQEAELLMENYDIITTDKTFAELKARLGDGEEWKQIISSLVYDRFLKRMDLFDQVGRACCEPSDGWFSAFSSDDGGSTIHGCFDAEDSATLHYRVRVVIPTKSTNAMVVANEIELLPVWNTLVVKPPETFGRRTAHYMVINYQMSFLGGMYKLDVLNEVRRFTDVEGGFLAEYIESCGEDHPSYRKPLRGYGRPQTKIKNVWTACGPDHTVLLQAGTLKLPFAVSKWIASTIGGIAGKFIIGGLIKNSMRSTEPDNPWKDLLASDKLGLYARLDECVACEASRARTPESFGTTDLLPFFERRRKQPK